MRKTILITLDYLPQTGGVANYWAGLNKFLPANLFYILAPQVENYINEENNVIRKKLFFNYFWPKWFKLFFIIISLQKKFNFEIFIAAQVLPVGTVLWLLKKFKLINKYFVSCHGFDILQLKGRKKILAKKVLLDASFVIANSNFTASILKKYSIPAEKISIITPCPNLKISQLASQQKFQDKNINYKIITTARLVPRKGLDTMILAMPFVWQKFPQTSYTIVGVGEDLKRLQNMANNNENNKIIFLGRLSDEELVNLYQEHDLFVMLPRNLNGDIEGFGMVYLEAGLFYLPVLATDSGGVSESVKHMETGLVLPDNSSPEVVANAIINLFRQPELLKNYGKNNRHWAGTFSWQKQAKILHNLLS